MTRRLASLIAPTFGLIAMAYADDRSQGVPLPGLIAQPAGSVRADAAEVDLTGGAVVLRLSLTGSGGDGDLMILGPRFQWLGDAEPYPERQFPELRATLNGKPLPLISKALAFVDDRDITPEVVNAGFDPLVVATSPPFVDRPTGPQRAAFDRLLAQHAIEASDNLFLARWTAQRIIRLGLGGIASATLTLSYRARPGFALEAIGNVARTIRLGDYCLTQTQVRERLDSRANVVIHTYRVYTGIDGRPPPLVEVKTTVRNSVFCGVQGKPVSGPTSAAVRGQPGEGAALQIVTLDPPG